MAGQIAVALDYAHSRKPPVFHRDLKPSNIMISDDGTVKLLDFGIAREMKDSYTRVTGQDTSGTLPYMSPQQLMGARPDASMDIYSLGAVLYECFCGHTPFYTGDIRRQIEVKPVDNISGMPVEVNWALQKALAKESKERPKTAKELVELLKAKVKVEPEKRELAIEQKPPKPAPVKPEIIAELPLTKKPSKSRKGLWLTLALVVIGILIVVVSFKQSNDLWHETISPKKLSPSRTNSSLAKRDSRLNSVETEAKSHIATTTKVGLQILWQAAPNGSGVLNNTISRVKLTPDNKNVMVFHYNGGADGIPTRVDKLDASTGNFVWPLPGYKTVTKPGERISLNGWVDGSGNLFIMGSWSGNTIWKYDSELATELCSYTGGSGFEYVRDAINDKLDNLYVAGMTGSGSNEGSRLVKLDNSCNEIWTCLSKNTSGKDGYTWGIALDSSKNVFRVGLDYSLGGASDRGRLIGHRASDGAEFCNYIVVELNSCISGITIDSNDYIYIAYCYDYSTPGQDRTVVQKLECNGSTANVVWEYRLEDIGMYLGRDTIVKHTGNSFYVAFNLRQGETTVPGIAEFDLNGNLLWKETIDKPGWNLSSIDAKDNYIYVGLTNNADGSQTQVLCVVPPSP
jgi:serine/threonine protein kinase